MRFKVNILLSKSSAFLPFDHQYYLASYIYRTIGNVDYKYFLELHNRKTYKFFTFSYLMCKKRKLTKDGIICEDENVYFFVSSPNTEFVEKLVEGMLKNPKVKIKKLSGVINEVKCLKEPKFKSKMKFKTISPILIRKPVKLEGKLRGEELYPTDVEFHPRLEENLKKKFAEFYGDSSEREIKIRFLRFKPKKHKIINTYHRCVLGEFKAEGDVEMIKFGYDCGFGEKNSMGFGMVKVV